MNVSKQLGLSEGNKGMLGSVGERIFACIKH